MNTEITTITCKDCNQQFESDGLWNICPTCLKSREAKRIEDVRVKREESIANGIARTRHHVAKETPALFRSTDTSHARFNDQGWARVKDWRPSEKKPWLGMIGETGTCKTRIACLLAASEMARLTELEFANNPDEDYPKLPSFYYVTGYELCEFAALFQSGSFDQKEQSRKYLDALRRADLIVIDDLGKGRINAAITAELFGLIDYRYSRQLITIWTANGTPEQIAAPMGEDAAAPFAGRLNDSSRIIRFK